MKKYSAMLILITVLCLQLAILPGSVSAQKSVAAKDTSAVLNNLANMYVLNSEADVAQLDSAIHFYQHALKLSPEDGGIYLNLGIVHLLKGDAEGAEKFFRLGFEKCDNQRGKAYHMLGMDFEDESGEKGETSNINESVIRENMEKSFSKIKPKKSKNSRSKNTEKADKDKQQKKKKKTVRSAGNKSLNPSEMKAYLYWKL